MRSEFGPGERLDFVVGSEIRLRDILSITDLDRLFSACMSAGASGVALKDGQGNMLKTEGDASLNDGRPEVLTLRRPLSYEGEQIGELGFVFAAVTDNASGIADMMTACMQTLITNTAKRLLTTELHTSVVNLSFDELLETNRRLRASEEKYRELAGSLEQKVVERTEDLKAAHARMLQQEKMASIGQLAAGMAHEINNPLSFIISNINTFEGYTRKMGEMIGCCRSTGASPGQADDLYRRLKIGFILEDIPELIRQSRDGAERVRKIVANLKGFSHVDDAQEDYVDLNEEIDRTIQVLEHESGERVTYIRHYGLLPRYLCSPGLICQVFLSIIQNAIQATDAPLQIKITTSEEHGVITVRIEDDGPGIPEVVVGRIFEPFFTTKDVGKGTGLGLSIAYDIIKNHGGEVSVVSGEGKGAAFCLRLPVRGYERV